MLRIHGLQVQPIIGLELHAQLATRTKLLCGCPVEFGAAANSRVCPVCLGLPGALPVLNRTAVEYAVRTALALNCRIPPHSFWERKNYWYPDLPKNYQISQYRIPLGRAGHFEVPWKDGPIRVGIRRVHLEEDAGKSIHDLPGFSGIDLNRAATPLVEIVTDPDLHSAEEVRELAAQLRRLLRHLGVSHADMERGQMRVEPNINVRIRASGEEYCTPIVEVKNLNSLRTLEAAVRCEIDRQVLEWQATGVTAGAGNRSNRGWDEARGMTVPQREKEEEHDYRYFPEPDLLPIALERDWVDRLAHDLPELPIRRAQRFMREFHVSWRQGLALVDDRATADLLEAAAAGGAHRPTLAKHFLSFWARSANERGTTIANLGIAPARLAELANLVYQGHVNATAAARLAGHMLETREPPTDLAGRLGLLRSPDRAQLAAWVEQAIRGQSKAVDDALRNPKKAQAARGFLVGQIMKASAGRADARLAAEMLEQRLSELATEAETDREGEE